MVIQTMSARPQLLCTQTLRLKDVTYTLLGWKFCQFKEYTEQVDEGVYNHIRCDEWELVAKNAEELCVCLNELRTLQKKFADLVQDTSCRQDARQIKSTLWPLALFRRLWTRVTTWAMQRKRTMTWASSATKMTKISRG